MLLTTKPLTPASANTAVQCQDADDKAVAARQLTATADDKADAAADKLLPRKRLQY
jgi:hypothetical protein